ncbi:hypothetical protein [Streptomyces sp. HB2AG]|uniref:hypothetical protein n=1 Tax=Streptomyces sp. HB2AG TaxID=2983400 RepID=UPI0022AAF3E6|nr:hypothetical protein [Streptomyces sp. HB2AG]MCZ2524639.1 hypothetical protein [Streptomyces sp. HB2AG]
MRGGGERVPVAARRAAVLGRDGYWCECAAVPLGPCRAVLLAGYRARSPRLALRWMRVQARRLAARLAPEPGAPWLRGAPLHAAPARGPGSSPSPDPVSVLRTWQEDGDEQARALDEVSAGGLYLLPVPDDDVLYTLSARPLLPVRPFDWTPIDSRADLSRTSR